MQYMQAALPANFTQLMDEHAKHIAYILRTAVDRDAKRIEASEEAETAWVAKIIDLARLDEKFLTSCTPGYYNGEGQINSELARRAASYGPGPNAYFRLLDEWRGKGDLAGLELC
jgi:cyclohexanone monooxygenase